MGIYKLKCLSCNRYIEDNYTNKCDSCNEFLRTEYEKKQLEIKDDFPGIWKYIDWLPVNNYFKTDTSIKTYKSEGLAKELGLSNLYISCAGYFPEIGVKNKACSFKELESVPTYQRMKEKKKKGIILASAGNTGISFAYMSHITKIPAIIVIPQSASLLVPYPEIETVRLIAVQGNDYFNAIHLASRIKKEGFVSEGGASNIARRDGMALVMIDAAFTIKTLPDHYFQAVGSGTGAISVWEAALRLLDDRRFGKIKPKLHISQNHPFNPIHNAWSRKAKEIDIDKDMANAYANINKVKATMLTNRKPPYSVVGGVYDALIDTNGETYAVTNKEIDSTAKLFFELEGIDVPAEPAVAIGSLIQAIEQKKVKSTDKILLNLTAAGFERIRKDHGLYRLKPTFIAKNKNIPIEELPLDDL
ncbi:MAG: cysteate synthase [Candidatus Hodarchaeota archaeon]